MMGVVEEAAAEYLAEQKRKKKRAREEQEDFDRAMKIAPWGLLIFFGLSAIWFWVTGMGPWQ